MEVNVLGSSSSGNCYLLQGKKETLILEAGVPYKNILKGLNFDISNVVGCLVTHEHLDHAKAIKDLTQKGIDVYASHGTLVRSMAMNHRGHIIKSEKQFTVGGFTVLPFAVEHDAAEPLGYLIQHQEIGKLLFITDSYYCKYKFKELNHIFIECNYSAEILKDNLKQGYIPIGLRNRLIKSHFSLENVKEFLKANDLSHVKEITLIHLSDSNSNSQQFKEDTEALTGRPVYVANKGLSLDLSIF
ncbi:MBL fold metallo-hydrolase [Clostridium magnum]|uniref:Putative metallo-hydrolase YycJ n=1 Tax=Clostridium magnum DSM 2767 TaxID=1121326 RepID=A0A161VY74_9CLOT|nr:MBL fold metallo-hydrolase [Clostridium magnum]KZL88494.1 putative metallo-hydrolase YycJ [Clostridium magnum DSM 2767]SHJ11694.1 Phosphoribosyl 1,2-cyclic phosphodiesterase [Clostridium magnum DSM 2767]